MLAVFLLSCNNDKKLVIKNFDAQNELGKNNEGTKSIYFLIQGYTGVESDYETIERHVCTLN